MLQLQRRFDVVSCTFVRRMATGRAELGGTAARACEFNVDGCECERNVKALTVRRVLRDWSVRVGNTDFWDCR